MKKEQSFWLVNLSDRNITLTDLALNIKAYTSINLLDKKHYRYTIEQLEKSKESGSIFNKKHALKVRETAPDIVKNIIEINKEAIIPTRERSIYSIKNEKYEELQVTDDEYAEEN